MGGGCGSVLFSLHGLSSLRDGHPLPCILFEGVRGSFQSHMLTKYLLNFIRWCRLCLLTYFVFNNACNNLILPLLIDV